MGIAQDWDAQKTPWDFTQNMGNIWKMIELENGDDFLEYGFHTMILSGKMAMICCHQE